MGAQGSSAKDLFLEKLDPLKEDFEFDRGCVTKMLQGLGIKMNLAWTLDEFSDILKKDQDFSAIPKNHREGAYGYFIYLFFFRFFGGDLNPTV